MRIGIDLGGTKIEGIALADDGTALARFRRGTPHGDYDATLAAIVAVVADLERETTAEIAAAHPQIDYLAKDYASFRRLMLDRLSVTMPDWRERNPADIAWGDVGPDQGMDTEEHNTAVRAGNHGYPFYAGANLELIGGGTPQSLAGLTRADLVQFRQTWWRPELTTILDDGPMRDGSGGCSR